MAITIDKLGLEVDRLLKEYNKQITHVAKLESEKVARKTRKLLMSISPERTGKYLKSWKVKRVSLKSLLAAAVVYSKKPNYRLTHLLEHGHASRSGGRVKAISHIVKAEEYAKQELVKSIVSSIGKIK